MHLVNGYNKAKELLQKKFGDKYKVAQAFVKKILSWTDLKADDTSGLTRPGPDEGTRPYC